MAGQQRVQNYLDRHRISALFEDLMARLIKNTPQEPIPYLIKILQKFDEKAKKPFQENPLAPKTKPLTPSLSKTPRVKPKDPLSQSTSSLKKNPNLSRSTGHLSRSTSNLAKEPSGARGGTPTSPGYSWQASTVAGKFGEDRGYERPWIANMKKIKYEQAQLKARKLRKSSSTGGGDAEGSSKSTPSSEADSMDVDQIFEAAGEKAPVKPKILFSNPVSQAWVDPNPKPYHPPPPKPYQPPEQVEEAFLKEELSADKLMKRYERESPDRDSQASEKQKIEQRRAKPNQMAKKHKEDLAALVEAQRKVETLGYLDSGETDDKDQGGFEEATDVLEDASDLMDEGVTNVKSTGQKVRRKPPPAPQVKVGVCSRCANVMGTGDGGITIAGFTQGYGAYTSIDSSSEVSLSSSSDFESASQVSGPRPMAWDGTTGDVGSTRPGATRSMTRDQASELFQSSTQYKSGGIEGGSTYRMQSTTEVRSSSQRWETTSYSSEVERRVTGTESLLERGRSWPQPGSDDDSSV